MSIFLMVFIFGYLFGSIPFGVILTKIFKAGDLSKIGSGNIGATNVLRTGRKGLAAGTLLGDLLKGTFAVILAHVFFDPHIFFEQGKHIEMAALSGFGAFIGHLYPVWLKFKGGKGVATYLGILLALAWPFTLLFGLIWLTMAKVFKYSSLAALIAVLIIPIALWAFDYTIQAYLFTILGILIFYKHSANIKRLMNGNESKIGNK